MRIILFTGKGGVGKTTISGATAMQTEVFGLKLLRKMGKQLYEGFDPAAILHRDQPIEFVEKPGGYLIRLKLPFIEEKDFELKNLAMSW